MGENPLKDFLEDLIMMRMVNVMTIIVVIDLEDLTAGLGDCLFTDLEGLHGFIYY